MITDAQIEAFRAAYANAYLDADGVRRGLEAAEATALAPVTSAAGRRRASTMITDAQVELALMAFCRAYYGVAPHDEMAARWSEWQKEVRAILEAVDRAAWQPIESAPKAGSPSLLLTNQDSVGTGYWFVGDYGQGPGWEWDFATAPTHWRPLPMPPGE